jgi:hypothetical protein
MIQYTGEGDQGKAAVILFGDGITTSININLTQSPFNIKFTNNIPVRVAGFVSVPVIASSGPPSKTYVGDPAAQENLKSVEVVQGVLRIMFNAPLQKVDEGSRQRIRIDVYFIYEVAPIVKKK